MNRKSMLFIVGLAVICSCTKVDRVADTAGRPVITATLDGGASKVMLVDDGYGDLQWEKGDKISVFDQKTASTAAGHEFTAASSAATTKFTGPSGVSLSPRIYALYPCQQNARFDKVSRKLNFIVPSSQKCTGTGTEASTRSSFSVALVAASDKADAVSFYNACSGVRFTVSKTNIAKVVLRGNSGEILAGSACATFNDDRTFSVAASGTSGSTSVELTTSSTFSVGKYYYISLIPGSFHHGFTLDFYSSSGTLVASTRTDSYRQLATGVFGTILNADKQSSLDGVTEGRDLSVNGPANCYIVTEAGSYKFPTCKGNSLKQPVVGGCTAEVLWSCSSSYNFDRNLIIFSVGLGDGYVHFKTPYALENGNAVIAVRDASGNILWSWHVWVVGKYDADSKAYFINGHTVMDRNLGALGVFGNSDKANGLLYQWGRKDPFPGYTGTASLPAIFNTMAYSASLTTPEYSVSHPSTFIYGDTWSAKARTEALWDGTSKSVYDPCPPGWRVPSAGLFKSSYAFSTYYYGFNLTDDNSRQCWFPMGGLIGGNDGTFRSYRSETVILSAERRAVQAHLENRTMDFNAAVTPSTGGSVRCIKD